jgi:hypothetical protein
MIVLDDLEQRFLAHLRGGEAFPPEWCAEVNVDSAIGLSIYANAYRSRLREALLSDHPVLSRYLGDALWERLCLGYIDAHPSRVRSLRHFGTSLPRWLAAQTPFSEFPVVSELAAWERLLLDVFDAADATRLDWSAVASLAPAQWPGLRLRFHPSLRCLRTDCNTVAIWRALKDDNDPPAVSAAATTWLLWRDEERITRLRSMGDAEQAALATCHPDAGNFAGLCERLAQDWPPDEVPSTAVGLLRQWFDEGLVCAMDVDRVS